MLQNPDEFFSGEQMARQLNVTRAAIWKHIDSLKKMGCEFESKPNRGYRLLTLPDALQPEVMSTYDISGVIERYAFKYLESTPSTNTLAKLLASRGATNKSVVIAEAQTEGKGRMGRTWSSEPGLSLTFSIILRPPFSPIHASKAGLIAGVCVAESIRDLTGLAATLKWPNDVLIGRKKVCGILTEMSADCDTIEYIVCGVGINVNQTSFSSELMPVATSLKLESGRSIIRGQLLLAFLSAFSLRYDAWVKSEDFSQIVSEYTQYSMLVGQTVSIESHGEKTSGICVGFDKDGFMIVELEDRRLRVMAGDVSVRSEGTYV
jgi:BirA family biotin operon repressor/biotin-[acetyl-CoA-carboxylase] ligase